MSSATLYRCVVVVLVVVVLVIVDGRLVVDEHMAATLVWLPVLLGARAGAFARG